MRTDMSRFVMPAACCLLLASLAPLCSRAESLASYEVVTAQRVALTAPPELTEVLLSLEPPASIGTQDTSPPLASTTIKTEGFEGAFPNDWILLDNNGATGGEVYWSDDNFRAYSGSWSGWAAGGGADGVPGGNNYPNDMDSWMIYGPFDLSDATAATLDFALWMETELDFDYVKWLASTDGSSFSGYQWSGSSAGWTPIQFDLSVVGALSEPEVWIAFLFQSDESVNDAGVYIDDVVIAKDVGAPDHDFALQTIDVANGIYAPGSQLSILTQVQNVGSTASPGWTIHYYLSSDAVITGEDTSLGYIPNLPSLLPAETYQFNGVTNLPNPLADGSYYIGAIVETADTNASNNTNLDATPISVSSAPDIDVWPLEITIEDTQPPPADSQPAQRVAESVTQLLAKAGSRGQVDVIVGLDVPFRPEGSLVPPQRQAQRAALRSAQASLASSLSGLSVREKKRFNYVPFVAMRVDAAAIQALAANPMVTSLVEDWLAFPTMASSNNVIGSAMAWADGWDGAGQAVAVLDTGVDATHPWLSGKIVADACYSTNIPGVTASLCPGGVESSIAVGSGVNCVGISGCDHGTHVAGTVAGNDGVGPGFGVARGADLIAMQVFTEFLTDNDCGFGQSPCVASFSSDQIAALERVYELAGTLDVAAVNMSLGGGRYFSQASCDAANAAVKAAIDNLVSVGVASAIASGNDGWRDSTGAPGCISTAVTVGATTDADAVASFSNIASFIDLLAPGVSITSSVPGGGTGIKSGTSMATPHVAGAFAVLKQFAPEATVNTLLGALATSGTPIDDSRSSGTVTGMPRINVDRALAELGHNPRSISIRNTGFGTLNVSSIAPEQAAPWLTFNPAAPFSLSPGESRVVEVQVDFDTAPSGITELGIVISSDDPDESPFPGGVHLIVVNNGGGEIFSDNFE